MSMESSPLEGPNVLAVLRGAVEAIRTSPVILGLFLVSGLLRFVLPPFIDSAVRLLLTIIGVVIAYRALGGQTRTDSPFLLRLFIAFLATLASYLLLFSGVLALALPGVLGWIAFLVLVFTGIYVYIRLFLSTPAAMIDGHGPAEALSVSWRLMNGPVLATAFALVLVFIGGILVLIPPLLLVRSSLIVNVGGTLIVDTLLAGMQAFLYLKLAETP
jgi:hypothetical protein